MANKVYTFRHWDAAGTGSGVSVVVAANHNLAFRLLRDYFAGKPDGETQRQSLPDWELHEDSELCCEAVTDLSAGVKLEYVYEGEQQIRKLLYLGYGAERLADELWDAQASRNEGRGVSCVRGICMLLRRGDLAGAKANAWNDGDKVRSHPPIVEILKRVGFYYEVR